MRSTDIRNPLASPALLAALHWLQPGPEPRILTALIRRGRTGDAVALVERMIADADRP